LIKSFIPSAKAKLMADKQLSEADLERLHEYTNRLFELLLVNDAYHNWLPEPERERQQGLVRTALADVASILCNVEDDEYELLMESVRAKWEKFDA
jgi:hypothetical protein